MKENNENPLGIENKEYTIEEFGATIRNKFGGDDNVSNTIIAEMFLAVYPIYSCLLYTSPSPRDRTRSRMPSSA